MLIKNSHFLNSINRAIEIGNNWAIAISGGADSLCLFLIIREFLESNLSYHNINLFLITINHDLRPETINEIEFLQGIAKFYNIPLEVLKWEHGEQINGNLYSEARNNRYKIISNYCKEKKINLVFTAHHLDDQIETFKMRLKSGMGIEGLASIQPEIIKDNLVILRPFLEITKSAIKEYLSFHNQLWIEDRTNYNTKYTRARIRNESFNKLFSKNISLVTKKMLFADSALEFYTKKEFDRMVEINEDEIFLKANDFLELQPEIAIRILKLIFKNNVGARRILFNDLIFCRNSMINLFSSTSYTLQFSNFNIVYKEDCFVFIKQNIRDK